jgi:SWI/SNF-related matrix-associated actin-dependent regulator of chromatin subfamily A3
MYPHQKQALSFLLDRERKVPVTTPTAGKEDDLMISLWKRRVDTYNRPIGWTNVVTNLEITGAAPPPQTQGAILADDMGIGKTIVVIALVAHTLEEAKDWAKLPLEREQHDPRFDEGAVGGKDGAGKELSRKDFMGSIPGEDLFEASGRGKGGSGKKKKKDAAAKREKKREDVTSARFNKLVVKSRATLIICPLSTVQNWESQFEEHVARVDEDGNVYEMPKNYAGIGSDESGEDEDDFKPASKKGKGRAKDTSTPGLSIYVYHGTSRLSDPLLLADFDVVITTFSTLGTEYSKQGRAELEREAAEAEADSDVEIMSPFDPRGLLSGDKNQALPAQPKPKRKRKRVEGNGESPLQQIQWWRIVLDEAQ